MEQKNQSEDSSKDKGQFNYKDLFQYGEVIIYALVAVCFFLGAVFTLAYSIWQLVSTIQHPQPHEIKVISDVIIPFVMDLLLILIMMEVFKTVTESMKKDETMDSFIKMELEPYLIIGIISATRSILAIGAQSIGGKEPLDSNHIIILGVSGAVILALGITIKLVREKEKPTHKANVS